MSQAITQAMSQTMSQAMSQFAAAKKSFLRQQMAGAFSRSSLCTLAAGVSQLQKRGGRLSRGGLEGV
eukprot:752224-Prorocentrum_minimum.AAC.1